MAYTLLKPAIGTRNLLRPRYPSIHHVTFDLRGIILLPQEEGTNTYVHTFLIPATPGCYTVYFAFFDGLVPEDRSSVSPIFAIEYCSEGLDPPRAQQWSYPSIPPTFSMPYVVIGAITGTPGGSVPPLEGTNCNIYPIGGDGIYNADRFSPSLPGCPLLTASTSQHRTYVVEVTDFNPTFNFSPWSGVAIYNVNYASIAFIEHRVTPIIFNCPDGSITTQNFTQPALANQFMALSGPWNRYGSGPTWTPPLPAPGQTWFPGPKTPPSWTITNLNSNDEGSTLNVIFDSSTFLTSFLDVTPSWRKRAPLWSPSQP